MKSYRKELWFEAPERMHFTNITSDIKACLSQFSVWIKPHFSITKK